ncbi:MAG: oligoendopeptidase F [Treponemataceae bacterium]|nr:oligoendopeptidase F [Treponemataceae bacterium]
MENKTKKIPLRSEIPSSDKWDLTTLFKSDDDWEKALNQITKDAEALEAMKGKLGNSAEDLLAALKIFEKAQQNEELVGNYAFLLSAGDAGDSTNQDKLGRYTMVSTEAGARTSWFEPELQAIPEELINKWIEREDFKDYKIFLQKELRCKPFVLSEKEERIMVLHSEPNDTAHKAFSMLTNVDLDYGSVNGEPLTQTTWSNFMESSDRKIRKDAYTQFYDTFDKHKNTIAALYAGSVNVDVCRAKARGFNSSIEKALFPDKVPLSVYNNLVSTVRSNFAPLHRYYKVRRKLLKLDTPNDLRHYDVYVPLVPDVKKTTTFDEAIEILRDALSPLGTEYTDTLCTGLKSGWVDRYENQGKRSGAFSSGAYTGYPYILTNYKEDVLRDVFTIAHEGGHSMHSWYSARSNPFLQYDYTIFEAEVASTFNEELLFRYYIKHETDPKVKAYLVSTRAADILATLYRQTMFAEYERKTHELVENGTPLSVEVLRSEYRKLLTDYFGPEMVFEETSDLEGLRIPHFYNAFYVYKYATGISAALALAEKVMNGDKTDKENYFKFLRSGGSRYPIESLKVAGVDMTSTEPVQSAINIFARLVDELEALV